MKNMKNDKTRKKILKTKYPFYRFKGNLYDDFHVYDLVDQMRLAKHDHRVLSRQLRSMWNQDEQDEELSVE